MNVVANPGEAIRVFTELAKQLESQDYGSSRQEEFVTINKQLERLRATIEKVFGSESGYLSELGRVRFRYARAKQKNAITYFNGDKRQALAVIQRILDELHIAHPGLIAAVDSPSVKAWDIQESLARFRYDYPDPLKTAFIMMSFGDTPAHKEITRAIKQTLTSMGLLGLRADDKDYHSDLYPNILTYMQGCGFGIAVFEQIDTKPINPNVAFEVGYMLALNKRVCLLKDKTLPNLHTDLIGKLYIAFDLQQIVPTIDAALSRWLATHIA